MNRNGKKRWFLKIHVVIDVKSKQITGLDITDDKLHDSKHVVSLVEQSKKFGNVTKALSDDAQVIIDDLANLTTGSKGANSTSFHRHRRCFQNFSTKF